MSEQQTQDPAVEPTEPSEPDPTPQPAEQAKEEKTFTQEEVNRIVKERAERMLKQSLGDGFTVDDLPKLKEKAEQAESDTERAVREAREQATNEVRQQYHTRAVRDAARAAAAGKWVNPDQATALVDLTDLDPDDDGFDTQVTNRLDAYLADNPHLAVPTDTPSASGDAGSRTSPHKADQLTRADLQTMSPEQIDKARRDGLLADLMGGKT